MMYVNTKLIAVSTVGKLYRLLMPKSHLKRTYTGAIDG